MGNPAPPDPNKAKAKPFDPIVRGTGRRSPAGTMTFVGLRLLDVPLQYYLLRHGAHRVVVSLGLATVAPGVAVRTGIALLDRLDLSPPRLLLLAMAVGAAAKQIFWATYLNAVEFPPATAAVIATGNATYNAANVLLFTAAATSSWGSPGPHMAVPLLDAEVPLAAVVGAIAFVAGSLIDTVSECQRKAFKARNPGRLCTVGMWRWARHINYFGYALWRGGYCMAGTGWIGGLLFGLFECWELGGRAADALDTYCGDTYGEQWSQFKKEVPYRLVPGVF